MRDRHARSYADLAAREAARLAGPAQRDAMTRLTLERANLRAAVRHLVDVGDAATATDIAWRLYLFWWVVGGHFGELSRSMAELLDRGGPLSPHERAVARFYVLWEQTWSAPTHHTVREFAEVADLFAESGDGLGVAMATATAGLAQVASGDTDLDTAAERLWVGVEGFREAGARWGEVLVLVALGRLEWLRQRQDEALGLFRRALEAAVASGDDFGATVANPPAGTGPPHRRAGGGGRPELGHDDEIAYGLEGLSAIAATHHDVERAGVLAGAAAAIRQRVGMYEAPVFVFHEGYLKRLRTPGDSAALDAAVARGREYGAREAAEFALAAGRDGSDGQDRSAQEKS